VLSEDQHLELSRLSQSRSLPAGYVFRSKLILMLAEGASYNFIKQRLGTTAPTISRSPTPLAAFVVTNSLRQATSAIFISPHLRRKVIVPSGHWVPPGALAGFRLKGNAGETPGFAPVPEGEQLNLLQ
jgi:hypothetical protein